MPGSSSEIKRKALEKRKTNLIEEYDAINAQVDCTLNDAERIRLLRRADDLYQQIQNVDGELELLGKDKSTASLRDYLEFIQLQCATLNSRDMLWIDETQGVVLPLEEVFINLRVGQNNPFEREAEQNQVSQDADELGRNLQLVDIEKSLDTFDLRHQVLAAEPLMLSEQMLREHAEVADLYMVLREQRWTVILGDPGSGKTTLVKWLCLLAARALLAGKNRLTITPTQLGADLANSEIDLGPARFPILIQIADYAKARREKEELSLINFIGRQPIFGQRPEILEDELATFSLDSLKHDNALVLIDGLDEIANSADRKEILDEIERFITQYIKDPINEAAFAPWTASTYQHTEQWWKQIEASHPVQTGGNQVLITSRKVNYRAAPLHGNFAHYSIEPLDDNSIQRFCRNWALAVEHYLACQIELSNTLIEEKAAQEANALIDSILQNKNVRKLATNPMLLTLLALLHREESHLPSQRIQLYKHAVSILIKRRYPADYDEEYVVDVLGPLALWLHENRPMAVATEAELRKQISIGLARWENDLIRPLSGKSAREVDAFVMSAREQIGLLVAKGEGGYGFVHLTFQEYFVARELTRDIDAVTGKLFKYLHKPRWQEPLLFAIAYLSDRHRELLEPIIESVLDADIEFEDILHRNLLFVAACIAESVWMPSHIIRRVTTDLLAILADETGGGRFKVLREQILDAFEHICRTDTARVIEDVLIQALQGSNAHLRSTACAVIAQVSWGSGTLLYTLYEALKLPGYPEQVTAGFNALLKRIESPEKYLPAHALTTLITLYEQNPKIAAAFKTLLEIASPARVLLGLWMRRPAPYIMPLLVNSLNESFDLASPEQSAPQFVTRLKPLLREHARCSAGAVYASAIKSIAILEGPTEAVALLKNDIQRGTNVMEGVNLCLIDFWLVLQEMNFSSWWESLLPTVKQAFFEAACQVARCYAIEDQAWQALHDSDPALPIAAAKLLQQLPSTNLNEKRLSDLEQFLEYQIVELEVAEDIIERATLTVTEGELGQTLERLRTWLVSKDPTHQIYAAYLLTKCTNSPLDNAIYDGLTQALCSRNHRWRQRAADVLVQYRRASRHSRDLIYQAAMAQYEEEIERRDGMASSAHSSFIANMLYDAPEHITYWADKLAQATDSKEKQILQTAMGFTVCTPNTLDVLLHLLAGTTSYLVQESIVSSLERLFSSGWRTVFPAAFIAPLLRLVKETRDDELRTRAASALGLLAVAQPDAYHELTQLCTSGVVERCIAGLHGLYILTLYTGEENEAWKLVLTSNSWVQAPIIQDSATRERLRQLRREIEQFIGEWIWNLDPRIRLISLSIYARVLLVSDLAPDKILLQLANLSSTGTQLLNVLFKAGDGADGWNSITCDCGQYFHTKLIEVIRLQTNKSPLVLAELVKCTLEVLTLPAQSWTRKRVLLAALAACAQELPRLANLDAVEQLQGQLLVAATDVDSFNVRRFALTTLGQFRRISSTIIPILVAGCRDLTIVQKASFQAIGSMRHIETDALPCLIDMLASSSTATVHAVAMIMKEIGKSPQAVEKQPDLRKVITTSLANVIRSAPYPRYVYMNGTRFESLDDSLFTALHQVLSDNPEEPIAESVIAESRSAWTGSQEKSFGSLDALVEKAEQLQESLQIKVIEVTRPGIRLVMRGNQRIQTLELESCQRTDFMANVNDAIQQTQALVAHHLQASPLVATDLIQSHIQQQDPSFQSQIQRMKESFDNEVLTIDTPPSNLIITGSQFFRVVELDGVRREDLREALNEAIQQSQKFSAGLLFQFPATLPITGMPIDPLWLRAKHEAIVQISADPRQLIESGQYYLQLGELAQAQAALSRAALLISVAGDSSPKSDVWSFAQTLVALGKQLAAAGRHTEALTEFQKAQRIYGTLNDLQQVGYILYEIAIIFQAQGDLKQALMYYHQAVDHEDQANCPLDKARILVQAGRQLAALRKDKIALQIFEEAQSVYKSLNMPQQIGIVLHDIANIHQTQGNQRQAVAYYQQAAQYKAQGDNPVDRAHTLVAWGRQLATLRDYGAARKVLEEARSIYEANNLLQQVGVVLYDIANTYQAERKLERAVIFYQQAADYKAQGDNLADQATTLIVLGRQLSILKQYTEALATLEKARSIYEELKTPQMVGVVLHDIANIYQQQGNFEQAVIFYQQAADYKAQGDNLADQATTLMVLGQQLATLKRHTEALAVFEETRSIYEKLDMLQKAIAISQDIAKIYRALDNPKQAVVATLPSAMRAAFNTHDLQAFLSALNQLPRKQQETIQQQLLTVGILAHKRPSSSSSLPGVSNQNGDH